MTTKSTDPAIVRDLEWTDEKIRNFWTYYVSGNNTYFSDEVGEVLIKKISKYLQSNQSILDYGCGKGHLIEMLMRKGFKAGGIEFLNHNTEALNEKFKKEENYLGAFLPEQALERKGQFDVLFSLEVIEHLNDAHLATFCKQAQDILAPNGLLVLSTPNDENLKASFVYCPGCHSQFHRMQHLRSWNKKTIIDYMKQQGFDCIFFQTTNLSLEKTLLGKLKLILKKLLGRKPDAPNLIYIGRKST